MTGQTPGSTEPLGTEDHMQSADVAGGDTICSTCDGSGNKDGQDCPACQGTGTVVEPAGGA